jgi:hypothetical protein
MADTESMTTTLVANSGDDARVNFNSPFIYSGIRAELNNTSSAHAVKSST